MLHIRSEGVIESFFHGILILTEQGKLVHVNDLARQICEHFSQVKSQLNPVDKEIWRVYQALIESRNSYHNQPVIIESEITIDKLTRLRLRRENPNLFNANINSRWRLSARCT
jgi:hypothetical protein